MVKLPHLTTISPVFPIVFPTTIIPLSISPGGRKGVHGATEGGAKGPEKDDVPLEKGEGRPAEDTTGRDRSDP